MDEVWRTISFGVARVNDERVDHELFDSSAWRCQAVAPLKDMARQQLGTAGSGNHYVDLFADEQDRVWVGVHFGSRGLGQKPATWFLTQARAKDGMDVEPLRHLCKLRSRRTVSGMRGACWTVCACGTRLGMRPISVVESMWRRGRVVECRGLENHSVVLPF